MAQRTCDMDGCTSTHLARGMCRFHYKRWHRETHGRQREREYHDRQCIVCDVAFRSARPTGKFCSDTCKGLWYSDTKRTKCPLPEHHQVMRNIREMRAEAKRIAAERRAEREVAARVEWRTARECQGCGCWFTPLYTPTAINCSRRCSRRMMRQRRRAREAGAIGGFTYSAFMRIARKFDYRCAYCGDRPGGLLEPDHVVPLSRGGSNSLANLLPSCPPCNRDKSDRLLHEWATWREERDKPPRLTTWAVEDGRFTHLTDAALTSPAA